jgi:hypothetical protein
MGKGTFTHKVVYQNGKESQGKFEVQMEVIGAAWVRGGEGKTRN